MSEFSFAVNIAGISIGFVSPLPMEIPQELRPFLCDCPSPQEIYEIRLIDHPVAFEEKAVYASVRQAVYAHDDGASRVFLPLRTADGCIPVCRLRNSGRNTLYIPASDWVRYKRKCTLSLLLGAESVFLRHNGLLLHSSVVQYRGEALLFCGASGAGKSTQAELWKKFRKAEILNGDRCVIVKRGELFYGCGSPYSGSSGIYRQEEAPIRSIILPGKAPENHLERLNAKEAFKSIYCELTINLWDQAFVDKLLDLLQELVLRVPVYRLHCRPEEEAVELTYQAVFGGI